MSPSGGSPRGGEIYVEFIAIGGSVKCTAIDAATGLEASVIGPSAARPADLERLAVAKLRRLIAQKQGGL
ncbi:MAG: serine hydroxymethyltransferase [Alphaproteobacteria bacterium]|nr:serine hydroxymethyltransferase [Alphaproteobacteria bacterium]